MGSTSISKKTIRILGAGFSGLTCAYYLVKNGFVVEIIEKTSKTGGILQTLKTPYGIVETGANAIMNSEALEAMAKDIGVELLSPLRTSKKRFIFRGGATRWPLRGFENLVLLMSLLKHLIRFFLFDRILIPTSGESLRQWGARVFSRQISYFTIETAMQGIYAGDPDKLSASLILNNFISRISNRKIRTTPKVKRSSVSPPGGMAELSEKLVSFLKANGAEFKLETSFATKEVNEPTVIAIPAYEAAKVLETIDPILSAMLAKIEYFSVITAQIFLSSDSQHLVGFGCLFPPENSNLILGVLFNQCIFKDRAKNAISENWILGGARVHNKKDFLSLSDHEILCLILEKRRQFFKSQSHHSAQDLMKDVLGTRITRWERAFPNYSVDLEALLPGLKSKNKNIYLHGNYLGDLGLAALLDRSRRLAHEIVNESANELVANEKVSNV